MIPAKLVGICVNDKEKFEFRAKQLPFVFDESTVMVIQFEEKNPLSAALAPSNSADLAEFEARFSVLTKEDIEEHVCLKQTDVIAMLSETAHCVGCRRSAEDMLGQAAETNGRALDPLHVTADCCVRIDSRYHKKPGLAKSLYLLLNNHINRVMPHIEAMTRCRRSRRCAVHSLDSQRPRTSTGWLDVWELMSEECRKEMAVVDAEGLLTTLNDYVQRHKFCSECKARVLTAYDILVGSEEGTHIKGFSASLYQKISACSSSNHLHLPCDSDFLSSLIARAEPELFGSQRERHANTVDAAQEEVLTCVGLHVFDRFHRLASRLRADHQTWNLLIYTCLLALKRKFEIIVEQRRGLAHIDAVCAELQEMDKSKDRKKQDKKKKRKEKKKVVNAAVSNEISQDIPGSHVVGTVDENHGACSGTENGDSIPICDASESSPRTEKSVVGDLCNCDCRKTSACFDEMAIRASSSDLDVESDDAAESSPARCRCLHTCAITGVDVSCISSESHRVHFGVVADSDESGRGSSPLSSSTPPIRSSPPSALLIAQASVKKAFPVHSLNDVASINCSNLDDGTTTLQSCKCDHLHTHRSNRSPIPSMSKPFSASRLDCDDVIQAKHHRSECQSHSPTCYCKDGGGADEDESEFPGGGGALTEEELRQYDAELLRAQREALRQRIREQFNLRLKQYNLAAGGGQQLINR